MPVFRVYFFGLIAHVSESGDRDTKDYAGIVRTPAGQHPHHPIIIFDPTFGRLINNSIQKIEVGTPQAAGVDQSFKDYVPRLELLMQGSLSANARTKTIEVHYPGPGTATLSAAQLYPKKAHYENGAWTHDQCVARATVVTLQTKESEITVRAVRKNGKTAWTETIELDQDRCVFIGNIPEQQQTPASSSPFSFMASITGVQQRHAGHDTNAGKASGHAGHGSALANHARIYGELLDNDTASQLNVAEDAAAPCSQIAFVGCSWIKQILDGLAIALLDGDTVECGNTQWP